MSKSRHCEGEAFNNSPFTSKNISIERHHSNDSTDPSSSTAKNIYKRHHKQRLYRSRALARVSLEQERYSLVITEARIATLSARARRRYNSPALARGMRA
ncbi:unnamed protein product, partial [Trichogramma brassicae]